MPLKAKRCIKPALEAAVLLVAALYIFDVLQDGWKSVVHHIASANWWLLVAAMLCFFAYFACRAVAWRMIMQGLGHKLSAMATMRMWLVSELGRYVPGNVWSFLGRVYLAEKHGVPRKVTATGLVTEVYTLVTSAGLFAVIFLVLLPYAQFAALRWLLVFAPLLLLLLYPKFFNWVLGWLAKFGKIALAKHTFKTPELLGISGVMVFGWALYGLASYLVLLAFAATGISWLWLVAMFVVSWLVGYLSFITPMGLGVREGVVVALLAATSLSGGVAGLVAIMSRLWLTVSELIIVAPFGATKLWRITDPVIRPIAAWVKAHRYATALGAMVGAFMAYFGVMTSFWHANFFSNHFDLGIMDQVVWNTAHGHFLQMTSPLSTETVSRFVIHADPILALFAPIYWFVSSPYVLIWAQVIIVALGALPLYWMGKQVTKSEKLALMVAACYLLFAPLQWNTTFAFHGVTLADTFLLFAFYYAYNKKFVHYFIFTVLILLTKETMALVMIGMGLYLMFKHRRWLVGLSTIVISAGWFCLLLLYVMPATRDDGTAHFAIGYYSQFGGSVGEIFKNLIFKPWLWIGDVIGKSYYFLFFLLPTAFIPLLAPAEAALAIPTLAINLLSNEPNMQAIFYQYTSGITSFTFIALIFGISRLRSTVWPWLAPKLTVVPGSIDRWIIVILVVLAIACGIKWGPVPGFRWFLGVSFMPSISLQSLPEGHYLDNLAKTIPSTASVSVTAVLQPHFSEREHIYQFPLNDTMADYVITQENSGAEPDIYPPDVISQAIRQMEQNKNYQIVYDHGAVEVFKRITPAPSSK